MRRQVGYSNEHTAGTVLPHGGSFSYSSTADRDAYAQAAADPALRAQARGRLSRPIDTGVSGTLPGGPSRRSYSSTAPWATDEPQQPVQSAKQHPAYSSQPYADPTLSRYSTAARDSQYLPSGPDAVLQRGQMAPEHQASKQRTQQQRNTAHFPTTDSNQGGSNAPYAYDYDPSAASGGARTAASRTARDMARDATAYEARQHGIARGAQVPPSIAQEAASGLAGQTAYKQEYPTWSAAEMAVARGQRVAPSDETRPQQAAQAAALPSTAKSSVSRSEYRQFDARAMAMARASVGQVTNAHATSSSSIFGGGGTEFWSKGR